jgi:hypothetical protein
MGVTLRIQRKRKGLLERLIRNFKKEDPKVAVGFPSGSSSQSNIMKAVYNEFGTKGSGKGFSTPRGGGFGGPIPERPFMRNSMRKNHSKYRAVMKKSALPILLGQTSPIAVLSKLGIMAVGDIQDEITSLSSPPNSPTTIRLKGSSNPLIDKGEMRGAVTWKIER